MYSCRQRPIIIFHRAVLPRLASPRSHHRHPSPLAPSCTNFAISRQCAYDSPSRVVESLHLTRRCIGRNRRRGKALRGALGSVPCGGHLSLRSFDPPYLTWRPSSPIVAAPKRRATAMHGFQGELLGTMILILLGDGVVAGVLLNRTKSQNAGWIVISAGWAFAVMGGVFTARAFGGKGFINPVGPVAEIVAGRFTVSEALPYIGGEFCGAFVGAVLVWLHYLPHSRITTESRDEARRLLHRPGDSQLSRQPPERNHRDVYARVRRRGHHRKGNRQRLCRTFRRGAGLGHRPEPGRHDRIRH